jgi:phytoene desaturase
MKTAVIGAGMGGLASAVELAAEGHEVVVYEIGGEPGGKVGVASRDGVTFDTGPSVLTMTDVLAEIFEAAGTTLDGEVSLIESERSFQYRYPDGVVLDIYHDLDRTLESVGETLGSEARDEFDDYLRYAQRIWEAAAPNFIFAEAPTIGSMVGLGLRKMRAVRDIDPMSTMWPAITSRVDSRHLRWLLARYATYVGSDPRQAPATLNCIGWLELGGGTWGVEGGMHAVAEALERVARRHGAEFRYETPVRRIARREGAVAGVETDEGVETCDAVVANAGVAHLVDDLLDGQAGAVDTPDERSMSGWTAVLRARRRQETERPPHTVLFPEDYLEEFADIFDRGRPPAAPTVYLCAQEKAHGREGWAEEEPLFAMVNAPPEGADPTDPTVWKGLRQQVLERLRGAGLIAESDAIVWERTPTDLAARFPGSRGAIYGASSNSRFAAFQRPANTVEQVPGLYLAGGSAHPGGGVPMCLQSGRLAAEAAKRQSGKAAKR